MLDVIILVEGRLYLADGATVKLIDWADNGSGEKLIHGFIVPASEKSFTV
jgi:hypothetical protein